MGAAAKPRVRTTPRPPAATYTRPAAQARPSAPPSRPPESTYTPPDWSQSGPSAYTPGEHQPYQYSWHRKVQPAPPSWIPRLAALIRHFVGSGFFWAFIIIQIVAILALPTGAPVLGTEGWTIVWLASFALPVVAIVIGVRKTAE
jgi:hypothetical protein